jgi:hypothetical protein
MGSCSRRNSCGGFIVCDETACSVWGACGGLCVDIGTSRATGCGGVSEVGGAGEAARVGNGSGGGLERLGGSGSLEEAVPT